MNRGRARSAAWTAGRGIPKTMPFHIYESLSPRGQHNNRFTVCGPGVWHPLSGGRAMAFETMGEATAGTNGVVGNEDGGAKL
jgi:hypothetical protein